MTVEQWLADLEAKAKATTPGPWEMKKDCDESDHMQGLRSYERPGNKRRSL